MLPLHNSNADVVSDLRDAEFTSEKKESEQDGTFADANNADATKEETAEGEEEVEDETAGTGEFQARTGAATDINSDLRNAQFKARTQVFEDKSAFENESKDRLTSLTNTDRPSYTTPSVIQITPSTPPVQQVVTPPPAAPIIVIGNLSVNDITQYESEGFLIFTVTLDRPVASPVTFDYKTSPITASPNGKDYTDVFGKITIPAGSTSVTIKVPITDDYVSDNGETIKITITNVVGNATITKPEGIGTILDNPVNNPENGTPNTPKEPGGYGEEDTVYAVIVGPGTVNEGNITTDYTVKLIDKDGNPVIVTKDTNVTVKYVNIDTEDNDTQYKNNDKITVTIKAGTSSNTFKVETKDDYISDNNEKYNLSIEKVNTNEFENVVIGDKTGNFKDVTTTIVDNTNGTPATPTTPLVPHNPYDIPNNPVENLDTITVRLFAIDAITGVRVPANEVFEGNAAEYIAVAFDKNGNEVLQGETVTVTFGKAGDTATANGVDYVSTTQTVTIGTKFNTPTVDDYIADNGEKFSVQITDKTLSNASKYETIVIDTTSVTTTIIDDSKPNTPNNPNDGVEPNMESVTVKLVSTDAAGNIIDPVTIPEGATAYYKAILVDPSGNQIVGATGTVAITFTDGTAIRTGTSADGKNDFTATNQTVTINTVFSAVANDDYIADNGETFNVQITDDTYSKASDYENVIHITTPIVTTIIDNSKPNGNTPHDPNVPNDHIVEGEDIVTIKLFAIDPATGLVAKDVSGNYLLANIADEGTNAKYIAYAFKDGTTTFNNTTRDELPQVGKVNVTFNDASAKGVTTTQTANDGSQDFDNKGQTVIIGQSFETTVFKDILTELGENYTVTITTGTYAPHTNGGYESVTIDTTAVTTTIKDSATPLKVFVKIEAITDSVNESADLEYKVSLVDVNGNLVTVPAGKSITVDLTYANVTTSDGDYTRPTTQVTITGGSSTNFIVPTVDDYYAEGNEVLGITISNITGDVTGATRVFEEVLLHTNANGAPGDKVEVTGTIKDNPANKDTSNPTDPTEPTSPGDNTPKYGEEDTVYVKIIENAETVEGGDLVHYIQLVDKDGKKVVIPDGEELTLTLQYTSTTGNVEDGDFKNTRLETVKITKDTPFDAVTGIYKLPITNTTKDDFVEENPNEVYTLEITKVTQISGAFENVAIGDKDGNYKSVTGTIKDGVTLGTPDNAIVDEDRFVVTDADTQISNQDLNTGKPIGTLDHSGKSLGIKNPNGDNGYTLSFDDVVSVYKGKPEADGSIELLEKYAYTADDATKLKSGGVVIQYVVSGTNSEIITGYKGSGRTPGDKVFDIVLTNNSTLKAGANPNKITQDSYKYTQYKNIDHPEADSDDDITFEFGFKITDGPADNVQTSTVQKFKVTVNDSMPSGINRDITLDEDGTQKIVISQESFKNGEITLNNLDGTGAKVIANGSSINIIDNTTNKVVVGVLTNNGDGTVTFVPTKDYSGTTAGFSYTVSDGDGDTAGATIGITVKPVADKPDMNGPGDNGLNTTGTIKTTIQYKEDDTNKALVEAGTESYTGLIGLILPKTTDTIDRTTNTNDDQPEKLGLITLSSSTGETIIINGNPVVVDSTGIKIFITDAPSIHYSGLDTTGAIFLTKAEFETLVVKFENDNAVNPKFKVEVTSYEVNDNDTLKTGVAGASNSQDYEVDILAVTDPVTLEWDNIKGTHSTNLGTISVDKKTFEFTTVAEGFGTINLTSLLTKTSGLENDTDGDLDGSEKRSYTFEGIPEGTIITIGSNSVAAGADGKATINFSDNTAIDPDFTMTLAKHFSGQINGKITLNVTDTDPDSTGTINKESASVNFTMTVTPVPNEVTLKVSQAVGFEDAGRTGSNDEKVDANIIDKPEDGIELNINVISDDNKDISGAFQTDAKEKYTVTIDGIPDGGSLYVYDKSSSSWKLINETNAGVDGNLTIVNNVDNTWKVTILDYQNNPFPKFIPPYNSDKDYIFNIKANSVDNGNTNPALEKTLQIAVTVNAVADIPVYDDLQNTNTATSDTQGAKPFTLVKAEDSGAINLKEIFKTPLTLASNDSDGSETLTFKVTGLALGFDIAGATFIGGTGTGRTWLVDITKLNADQVTLTTPVHYAGEVDFKIQFVTTEDAGDSKTHLEKDVSIMITPLVDGSINLTDTQDEDVAKFLNFELVTDDKDGANAGQESIHSFTIDVTGLEAKGIVLKSNGVDISTGKTGHQTVTIIDGKPNVEAILKEDSDDDYSFKISYVIHDVAKDAAGNTYTHVKTVTDEVYNVTVNAITDDITLSMATTTGINNTVDGSGKVTVTGNGTFTKTLTVKGVDSDGRGNLDIDGSEEFTRVTVSGVPEGITVVGGQYAGDTGGGNYSGFWYVDIPNIALNNASGVTYDLVFNVDGSFQTKDVGDYTINVTAFNQEKNNLVEQNDSQSFVLNIQNIVTGPGPGTPAVIVDFYQDIDQDGTRDHFNALMADVDAYQKSFVKEDTQFKLSDVVHVEILDTNGGNNAFSITLKNVPTGVEIKGMTYNAQGDFYTLSGKGNPQAVIDALQAIKVTPKLDMNTDGTSPTTIGNTDLAFDIELTTYASGGVSNTALINFTASVLPVTDKMDLTVVNSGSTDEDIAHTFSITMDNTADGAKTQIIGGKVYIKLTEGYTDTVGTDGNNGTLTVASKTMTATAIAVTGVAGIADGNYYVIEGVAYNDKLDFTYTPAANRDGKITVDVYVQNKETESWTTHETDTLTSHKKIEFDVKPVADGFTLGATITGTEDVLVPLAITLTSTDSSEKLSSVSISGLPNGFLFYYGENADGSGKKLANNLGALKTQITMQMTYGKDELVNVNNWNIPLTDGKLPAYIWIKTPENWSGVIPALSVTAVDAQGVIYPLAIASGTVTPVVDTLTLNATQTFGKEGQDILLNLNANVVDLDGSETVTLTLKGFGDGAANFKASGLAINSVYDADTDTYTIEKINVNDINALTVTHGEMGIKTITAKAQMLEDGVLAPSSEVSSTFNIEISKSVASSGDDTFLLKDGISFDGLGGNDTLVLNGKTLDSSKISNIEILDLSAGTNTISSLTLQDVLNMTDSNKQLKLFGDDKDSVLFKNGTDTNDKWTKGAAVTDGTKTFDVYTNTKDTTVQVKVEQAISDGITN